MSHISSVQEDKLEIEQSGKSDEFASKINLDKPLGIFASIKDILKAFHQEHICFILACIYLIFEYNRPQIVYPAIDIIPWTQTIILVGIFFAFMDRTSKLPPKAAVMPMVAFSICVFLSMQFAFSSSIAFENWVDYFAWVFVVFLLTGVINTRMRLFLFIAVYFLANLKMAQHGFRSWAMGGFGYSGWGVTGSPGWFRNSGEFSMQMAMFLPLVLAYIAVYRKYWSLGVKLFFYLLVVMAIGSIIASSSRGGILGLTMVGLWFLMYSRKRVKILFLISIASFFVYISMPDDFKARFETIGEDETSLARLQYIEYAKESFKEHLITGIGYKNWIIWVGETNPKLFEGTSGLRSEVLHNTYWQAITELGLLGGMVYFFILLQIYLTNRKLTKNARIKEDCFIESTAMGLNGSIFVYLLQSYSMSVLYYPFVWILLSLTVSLSFIYKQNYE